MNRYRLFVRLVIVWLFFQCWTIVADSCADAKPMTGETSLNQVIVATRIHSNQGKHPVDSARTYRWAEQVLTYADRLLIATDQFSYPVLTAALSPLQPKVHLILVNPWKGFTSPLNALLFEANLMGVSHVLFQSAEVDSAVADVACLRAQFDANTLVVGARLTTEHGATLGCQQLDGLNSPWNTMALWDVKKLSTTGFIHVSDGAIEGVPGGMEEVATISLLQHIYPDVMRSKLIKLPQLTWQTYWSDANRQRQHLSKMASKYDRAEKQLTYLQLPRGSVCVY